MLFCDVHSFTTRSENMAPEALTALMNRYFARMTAVIHAHGGTLDKFIGDGIMAFFGAPAPLDHPQRAAFAAAAGMLEALRGFNAELAAEGQAPFAAGIGLHHGPAVVGYLSSPERHEYTAVGDTVNAASRIEGLTKELGCPLLVSDTVACALDVPGLVPLGPRAIRGRGALVLHGWQPAD